MHLIFHYRLPQAHATLHEDVHIFHLLSLIHPPVNTAEIFQNHSYFFFMTNQNNCTKNMMKQTHGV